MKKNYSTPIGSLSTSVASSSHFFSKENDTANVLQPLYLFCTTEEDNKLFFISSSRSHCWIREENVWEKLKIKHILLARDGGSKTYYFDDDFYGISSLEIPFPFKNNATYSTSEREINPLTAINLSHEELDCNDITPLETFNLTAIPETREQAQQQLGLAEKKQALKVEIQNTTFIIHSLECALETILKLKAPERASTQVLTDQIRSYEKIRNSLNEKQVLLENPIGKQLDRPYMP